MSKGSKALAILVGRMGDDVKVREKDGNKFGSLRLACTDGFGDRETTSWFDVVVFDNKKTEVLEKYTHKGSRIMVIGTLRVRKWTDKDGNDRYTTEVVVSFDGSVELLDSKDESQGQARPAKGSSNIPRQMPAFGEELDDDVPF